MKPDSQFQPPRQTVVYGHTRRMLDETATNVNTFAMVVAHAYLALVAPDVRNAKFRLGEGDALFGAMRNNAQILRRFMDGTVKVLPADVEDAWVTALPEPYRSDCERDLAKRRGRLSVKSLPSGEAGAVVGVSHLAAEFGQLLEALAPALADGRVTTADIPYAKRILNESDDLIAAVLNVRRQITEILPGTGERLG
ncbi:hypothetical protein [Lysobacter enzymogenes]|uniref:hypothetical protein n=1 Tax=Lysobacter enzymogenes TaxID=69 RepID=UPI00099B9578|nr:hypothetical protein [Lysobacter enzymogenes]UZW62740.1 hypothetical protein BV903_010795 [Lysobacter enzymogenes]